MPQISIDDLLAKQEITELLYRYCRGIDRLDWDLVRTCYHDDAFDDHGLVRGGVDEFVAFFTEMLTPMIATTHMLGNILITLDGDIAGCESQILAWHRIPADDENPVRDLTAQGRYVDRIERRDGEWRIAHRTVVFDWTRIEPAGEEFPVGPDGIWSRHDRDDLSYAVLEHRAAVTANAPR
jgi:3-phenylpropionate/cinnamic acid dioxygenase small subunit